MRSIFVPDFFPTSCRPIPDLFPASSRPLPDLFPTSSRPLPDLFPTSSRPLPDLFESCWGFWIGHDSAADINLPTWQALLMRQAEASSGKIFLVPYTVQRILSYISYHITKTGTFVRHMHVGTHHLTLTLNLLRVYEDKPAGQRSKHSLQIWKKHSASQSADLVFILYFISGALIWDSTVVSTLSTLSFTPPWTMQ